jgi:hypothetical protein
MVAGKDWTHEQGHAHADDHHGPPRDDDPEEAIDAAHGLINIMEEGFISNVSSSASLSRGTPSTCDIHRLLPDPNRILLTREPPCPAPHLVPASYRLPLRFFPNNLFSQESLAHAYDQPLPPKSLLPLRTDDTLLEDYFSARKPLYRRIDPDPLFAGHFCAHPLSLESLLGADKEACSNFVLDSFPRAPAKPHIRLGLEPVSFSSDFECGNLCAAY